MQSALVAPGIFPTARRCPAAALMLLRVSLLARESPSHQLLLFKGVLTVRVVTTVPGDRLSIAPTMCVLADMLPFNLT
jgi:hypothetical protein